MPDLTAVDLKIRELPIIQTHVITTPRAAEQITTHRHSIIFRSNGDKMYSKIVATDDAQEIRTAA